MYPISIIALIFFVVAGIFLKPLPGYNFLSVLGPFLLLVPYSVAIMLPDTHLHLPGWAIFLFINMSAPMLVELPLSVIFGVNVERVTFLSGASLFLNAAIPSLLIYLGICLRRKRESSDLRAYDRALASDDGLSYSMDEVDKIFDGR